jgi:hypothetical protein
VDTTSGRTTPGTALDKVPSGSFVRIDDLPGSPAARSCALSRARKAGQLLPIRNGLYFKGVTTRYGMTRPSPEDIALQVLGPSGVGPTGVSAARALGLTTQVPAQPTLSIAGPVPTSVPGVKISKRNNMRRRALRFIEIALVELLRGDWERTVDGGWPALVTACEAAMRDHKIDLESIGYAIKREHSPAARENYERLVRHLRPRDFHEISCSPTPLGAVTQ